MSRVELEIPDAWLREHLRPVSIPPLAPVRYAMPTPPAVADVGAEVRARVRALGREAVGAARRAAIAVGSRGVDRVDEVVAALVAVLREWGLEPFIVPAMGSHGGSTAAGQRETLAHLGVTEGRVGAPIRSSLETVVVGHTPDGLPVHVDRLALGADGICLVARVKPHTGFRGAYESGPAKMLAIGLGKQAGAAVCHGPGWGELARVIPAVAAVVIARAPILFAVALLENAHDRICTVAALPAAAILAEEPALLAEARAAMPRLPFDDLDILVIDEIGKDISGEGADPNVTGRYSTPWAEGGPRVSRQVLLDVTDASDGNAIGMGNADFVTRRLVSKARLAASYPNALTATLPRPVAIPLILPTDRLAIAAAVQTCNVVGCEPRLLRIPNTLRLGRLQVSAALLPLARDHPHLEALGEPRPLPFDERDDLRDLGRWHIDGEGA